MNSTDQRPRYPKSMRLEMDPRDVWAATRRPPNVPEALSSTFSDLYWKALAVVHHAGRVIDLEQKECADLVERLKKQSELAGIAQTCSSALRFEYEAMLGAAYAAQNLLARAVIESLIGATLEGTERVPTFSALDETIDRTTVRSGMTAAANRARAAVSEIRSWNSPDFFERRSPRHRVVHREHLRCSPIFAKRMEDLRMKPARGQPLGVAFASKDPISCVSQYSPDIEMGYLLVVRQDGQTPTSGDIYVSPPREVEQADLPLLSARAVQVTQEHLLAAATLLDALSEGPDPLAGVVSRQEAARRATPRSDSSSAHEGQP